HKRFPLARTDGFPSAGLAVLPHKNIQYCTIFTFFFLPFSPGDAYNTRFFSGILLIRFFCNFSLRTAGNSLFTAFSPDVDFFKVSFFLFFQD
ncbi:hypothetical protein, partial [Blautia wexlerae]|uniref:hypothetical protein n=1 Tax=Blautia wexlerae TaxID=418240 RepID=UPI001A9BBC52